MDKQHDIKSLLMASLKAEFGKTVSEELSEDTVRDIELRLKKLYQTQPITDNNAVWLDWINSITKLHEDISNINNSSTHKDQMVPIGEHKLPPLPYPYNALEPYIDEETMRIHHDILHKNYVEGLNKAEKELQTARNTSNYDLIKYWEGQLSFNGAGHYLHTLFWEVMTPNGKDLKNKAFKRDIEKSFGSFDKFKEQFSKAAERVQGVGWALLVWSPRSRRLAILQAEKHQNLSQQDVIPLLALDVWEHAYYLKYKNKRSDYIKAWWNIVNWDEVEKRWGVAKTVMWKAY